ncbi:MAG TPA: Ig-like domain-containing protein [Kofleriaceae bacterium]|nr:Ig-like domain-containing protein [Kofleriaceae bacterium]
MRGIIVGTWVALALAACGDGEGPKAPVIAGASLATDEDAPVAHTVEASDPAGRELTLAAEAPSHGTVAVDRLGVTYMPAANYHGPDSFKVTVSNGVGETSAQIDVTVRSVNDVPTAVADSFGAGEDTPLVRPVAALLMNDRDADGDTLTVTSVQSPSNGTVSMVGTDFTFTPAPNFGGMASFQYTVSDGTASSMAMVTINVGLANDAPVATDDAAATAEDTAVNIARAALVANDTDPDGDTLTVTAVANPTHGTVALSGTTITFTPAASFNGVASFEYTITDGIATDVGVVGVVVTAVNDAPVASDDSTTTPEDTAAQLTSSALVANDTDVDNGALTVTAVSGAVHGTVTLAGGIATFTPDANYSGPASFVYTVSDGTASDTGTVTITVTSVNDAPVANDNIAMTAEDTVLVIAETTLVANDTDVDTTTLTVTQVSGAVNGTVTQAGGHVTFTPNQDYTGMASFTYTVSDGSAIAIGVVTITVTPINDAPVASDDNVTTAEDTGIVIPAGALLANDTDIDSMTLTVTLVSGAVNGTVTRIGSIVTFTPAANFNGAAGFTYRVSDGSLSATGVVAVRVDPVNDAPVAVDDTAVAQAGTARVLSHASLLANDTDIDGDPLALTAVQNPVHGTVVRDAVRVTFTPDPGYTGPASFQYVASDGTATATATVNLTVQAGPVCGDGLVVSPETCDDGNADYDDGCSDECAIEPGWSCTGQPSTCTTICGDGSVVGGEQCDDGDTDETDGCTTSCIDSVVCNATSFPGGARFAVDPDTGHCYVGYENDLKQYAAAETACEAVGGYLATITSAAEQGYAHSVQSTAQNPWIGAGEDATTTDAIFDWVTNESFGYTSFAPGQPDNDATSGGNGNCLHLANAAGEWGDTNCNLDTFVSGRICEITTRHCGDSVRQLAVGEECDDGNVTSGDGCSATCQREDGCGDGNIDPGEECDDNNVAGGDGCSATCQRETGCGNGVVEPPEECDDDNTVSGDGCTATCQLEVAPQVVSTAPADAAASISITTSIAVTFDRAMSPGSLIAQPNPGPCTGTIQVSLDNFASCVGLGFVAMSADNTGVTAPLTTALAFGTTYKIRVTTAAKSSLGVPMTATFTQAAGFTARLDLPCAAGVIISQVYGGGGNGGAPFLNDFIELHNPTNATIDLTGAAVQYASAGGATWQVTPLGTMSLGAGAFLLIKEGDGSLGQGVPLPTPEVTGNIPMAANAGKVALTSTTTPLTGACPTGGTIVDLVGYGATASCFEGTAPAPALSNELSAQRQNGGCGDGGSNTTDYFAATPVPRNTVFGNDLVCACSANESNAGYELDFCNLQFPAVVTVPQGAPTGDIFARVFEAGVTESPGSSPIVRYQIGVGPVTANPQSQPGWQWAFGVYNAQLGNDDEYRGGLSTFLSVGTYSYTARFSVDGRNWTYCDLDGAGSNAGLSFDPARLGKLTVTPP